MRPICKEGQMHVQNSSGVQDLPSNVRPMPHYDSAGIID